MSKRAPCCCTVAAAGADAEWLSCRTVATAGAGVKVSPAVTSSHCSSMAAWYVCVLGLDGQSCIYSFPLQLSKESEFSFAISSTELRPTLVLVLCVCALCSPSLLLPLAISYGHQQQSMVGSPGEWSAHPCRRSGGQHYHRGCNTIQGMHAG